MMNRNKGFSLLEILLAIVIFVVGMLALAHLQTNLTRSATDANTRSVAAGIAEEILEELRGFRRISTDPGGQVFAFADIDAAFIADTVSRGGNDYVVTADVKGYNFNSDDWTAVTETDPAVAGVIYDFKKVELTVTWNNNQEFLIDEGTTIANTDMDSGYIVLKDVIHSIPALADAVVAVDQEALGGPMVDYEPGELPKVVRINLDGQKFKESRTPKPDVVVHNNDAENPFQAIVETWFDAVTFNLADENSDDDTTFIRREEFVILSCECQLNLPSGTEGTGHLPTTWNGETYTEGEWVRKPYGTSANNQQSKYCDTCCRDHHDEPGNTNVDYVFDPWRDWTSKVGAHKHYFPNGAGGWDEAGDGEEYLEACRMVRKDGFMRVAQDFRQEGLIATREAFFKDGGNVTKYSAYVTGEVDSYYPNRNTGKIDPPGFAMPGDATGNAIPLLTMGEFYGDQQISRAIYVDHFTQELKATMACVASGGSGCDKPAGVNDPMEILPFYEIQTTWLSWWYDNVYGKPVLVTSEKLKDDNAHSRGKAILTDTSACQVVANTWIHRGNVGLTSTDPIDPFYYVAIAQNQSDLYIDPNGGGGGGCSPPYNAGLSGTVSSAVDGLKASGLIFTGSGGVACTSDAGRYDCAFDSGTAFNPMITITGYRKNVYICDSGGFYRSESINSGTRKTTFSLLGVSAKIKNIHLDVQDVPCTYL